jgi:hypothetical protein
MHKLRIALAVAILALAAASSVDSASADTGDFDIVLFGWTNSASAGFSWILPYIEQPDARRTMMLHKVRTVLAATVLALAAVSAVDSASASFRGYPGYSVGYFLSPIP